MDSGDEIIPNSAAYKGLAEQKHGRLCRYLVTVGEQRSVTRLRLPNLLANRKTPLLQSPLRSGALVFTLTRSQELRVWELRT